jgi:hypothetical protein
VELCSQHILAILIQTFFSPKIFILKICLAKHFRWYTPWMHNIYDILSICSEKTFRFNT